MNNIQKVAENLCWRFFYLGYNELRNNANVVIVDAKSIKLNVYSLIV